MIDLRASDMRSPSLDLFLFLLTELDAILLFTRLLFKLSNNFSIAHLVSILIRFNFSSMHASILWISLHTQQCRRNKTNKMSSNSHPFVNVNKEKHCLKCFKLYAWYHKRATHIKFNGPALQYLL